MTDEARPAHWTKHTDAGLDIQGLGGAKEWQVQCLCALELNYGLGISVMSNVEPKENMTLYLAFVHVFLAICSSRSKKNRV